MYILSYIIWDTAVRTPPVRTSSLTPTRTYICTFKGPQPDSARHMNTNTNTARPYCKPISILIFIGHWPASPTCDVAQWKSQELMSNTMAGCYLVG